MSSDRHRSVQTISRFRPIVRKTWMETKTVFLLGLAAIFVVGLALIAWQDPLRVRLSGRSSSGAATMALLYSEYIHRFVLAGAVQPLTQMLAVILGVIGLEREREQGTISLTLSLPFRRSELIAARVAAGFLQVTLLAAAPLALLVVCSPIVGQYYPLPHAIGFWVLSAVTQYLIFSGAMLLSTFGANQLTSMLIAWLLLWAHSAVAVLPALRAYGLGLRSIATGMGLPYVDQTTGLLIAVPGYRLASMLLLSLVFIAITVKLTERRDY